MEFVTHWHRLSVVAAGVLCVGAARAQTVTIDFESFPGPDGKLGTLDDIPVVPGVGWSGGPGLTNEYSSLGIRFVPDPPFLTQNIVTRFNFVPNQTNVLGSFVNPIRAEFVTPASDLGFDLVFTAAPIFPIQIAIYRADGSIISTLGALGGTVSLHPAEPIYGFSVIGGPPPEQTAIDNLTFTVVPAPASAAVIMLGMTTLRVWRRQPRACVRGASPGASARASE